MKIFTFLGLFLTIVISVEIGSFASTLSKKDAELLLTRAVESPSFADYVSSETIDIDERWLVALIGDVINKKTKLAALKGVLYKIGVEGFFFAIGPLLPEGVRNALSLIDLIKAGRSGLRKMEEMLSRYGIRTTCGELKFKTRSDWISDWIVVNERKNTILRYCAIWQEATGNFEAFLYSIQPIKVSKLRQPPWTTMGFLAWSDFEVGSVCFGAFKLHIQASIISVKTVPERVNLNFVLGPQSFSCNESWEQRALKADTDEDFLSDFEELKLGTDPLKEDTDGDGFIDGSGFELDPLDPTIPLPGTPPPPNLKAKTTSFNTIELSWEDNTNNEDGFHIYRCKQVNFLWIFWWGCRKDADFTRIDSVSVNQQSYIDSGLEPNTRYCYQVSAYNTARESKHSNKVCVRTRKAPPTPVSGSYFPLAVGNRWEYDTETIYTRTGERETREDEIEIIGTRVIFGEVAFVAEEKSNDRITGPSLSFLGQRTDGVVYYGSEGEAPDHFCSQPALLYKLPFFLGSHWISSCQGTTVEGTFISYIFENEVVSVNKTVITPAGTFSNCVEIKREITTNLTREGPDGRLIPESFVSYDWLAPGVGIVKSESYPSSDTWYHDTFILTSYQIQGKSIVNTGMGVRSSLEGVIAYPNPARRDIVVQFRAKGQELKDIQLQIYNLSGKEVFNSGCIAGQTTEWNLMNNQGEVVANGIYLYIITVRGYDNEVIRSRVKKLVVLR